MKYAAALMILLSATPSLAAERESVYDRVMKSQTIRCGYMPRPPIMTVSPQTGEKGGIYYEYVEALGRALKLKIDWAEEVGWGDTVEALRTGRIDAFCSGLWPVAHRAPHMDFVDPILYEPMLLWAREGETKFDNNKSAIDNPAVTIVAIEGSAPWLIAQKDFPKAKMLTLPQLSSQADVYMALATGKADIALGEPASVKDFQDNNPGKIRKIMLERPLRAFGPAIAVRTGEMQFRRMLDLATAELMQTGEAQDIVKKHQTAPGNFYLPAMPYEVQQ